MRIQTLRQIWLPHLSEEQQLLPTLLNMLHMHKKSHSS
jgi:hypothetical protein